MLANCAVLTAILTLVGLLLLLEHLTFLRDSAWLILRAYAWPLAILLAVSYVNLLAVVYLVARRLWLKDTGRKLAHIEHQLRTGDTMVRDLSARLEDED